MSTKAQTKANRQNARKSTGPQTAEGKAAVSQNAVKHGIFAESVIKGEDPADYEAFHDQFLAELAPVGMRESVLAERVISLWWRLRRAERMQNQVIDDMIGRIVTNNPARRKRECYYINQGIRLDDPRVDLDDLPLGRIATRDWSNCKVLDRMLMYERRIENSATKMMKELKRFQVIRRLERQEVEKQREPSPSQSETATQPAVKKGKLKKQTQYVQALMDARPFIQRDYDNNPAVGIEENKANQSQSHAPALTKGAGETEKTLAAANSLTG